MRSRRTRALEAAAALTGALTGTSRPERRQPRQAGAAPGRVHWEPEIPTGEDGEPLDDRPSKTALKQEAHNLQALGDALAAMSADRLATLPMEDSLRSALEELRRTRSHEGLRRQRQYVGKLMRQQDIEPLAQAVAEAHLGSARQTLHLHRTEALRMELVAHDEALTRFLGEHPQCDAQRLRTLIRNARREAALPPEQRHGRAWRELFQFIKPFVDAA
jgi:ribosome-associated protein